MDAPVIVLPEPWISGLEIQFERVRDEGGATAVHAMRVAAGRMSVWIEIAGRHALHDDLRWLRRSAATLRDIDVMLGRERAPLWEAELRLHRALELAALRAVLATSRPRAIAAGLRCIPPPDERTARKGMRRLARRVLREGDRMMGGSHDAESMHRVRRRLRRLRYALEWLDTDAGKVKKIQDAFGDFNDRVVELAHVQSHPELQLSEADLLLVRAEHDETREHALAVWASHRSDLRDLAHGDEALET
jgi:CHAD domain-containing protein